jgi:hypothetical protein
MAPVQHLRVSTFYHKLKCDVNTRAMCGRKTIEYPETRLSLADMPREPWPGHCVSSAVNRWTTLRCGRGLIHLKSLFTSEQSNSADSPRAPNILQ